MIAFALFLIVWACIGLFGVINCKTDRINYEMLAFIAITPVIPLIAKFFGIL